MSTRQHSGAESSNSAASGIPAELLRTKFRNLAGLFRFGMVGAGVCGLDLLLIWLMRKALPPMVAVSLAYLLAVAAHFCLNKWWVFKHRAASDRRQMGCYLLTVLACWLTTMILVSLGTSAGLNLLTAKLLAIPPTTIVGFVLMRRFVFAPPGFNEA